MDRFHFLACGPLLRLPRCPYDTVLVSPRVSHAKDRQMEPKTEATVFYDLILEVTYCVSYCGCGKLPQTQSLKEKAMAPHSSTLAWKIPWTAEPGRLQSMGLQGVDATERLHFHALEKEMATHSSVLAWRIPGTGEHGGLPSMGSHRVGHD